LPCPKHIASEGDPFCGEGIYPRWAAKQPQLPTPWKGKNHGEEEPVARELAPA